VIDITRTKVKDKVYDRWYPDWGTGHVTRIISRNRIEIFFDVLKQSFIYDRPHARQFLEPCPQKQQSTKKPAR
jgi:hypothetical protein